jgi:hypothetical protein
MQKKYWKLRSGSIGNAPAKIAFAGSQTVETAFCNILPNPYESRFIKLDTRLPKVASRIIVYSDISALN